jgi:hypothetical protein
LNQNSILHKFLKNPFSGLTNSNISIIYQNHSFLLNRSFSWHLRCDIIAETMPRQLSRPEVSHILILWLIHYSFFFCFVEWKRIQIIISYSSGSESLQRCEVYHSFLTIIVLMFDCLWVFKYFKRLCCFCILFCKFWLKKKCHLNFVCSSCLSWCNVCVKIF